MSGLSSPRIIFGVHSLSPYSRTDHTPYGLLKVIGSANMSMTSSVEQLYAGASRFAWAAESKTFASDVACKAKAYPGFLFTQWLGANVADNAAETGASVVAIKNVLNASIVAATGIATVTVKSGSEADVKFGKYIVKATDTTHVDVYLMSDVDIARGNAAAYQNDALKITATPLAIAMTTAVTIPDTGLQLTGGSGTIGMVAGDTAEFYSRPINTGSTDILIGGSATSLPAFGAMILAQKRATAEMFEIEAFNCVGSGMPLPMDEMAFSMVDLKLTCLYDSVQDAVFKIRSVSPSTFN